MVCCVFECKYGNRSYHGPPRTTHQFPKVQTKMYRKWVKAINIVRFSPSKKSYVCGIHFKPEDYVKPEENLNNKGKPKIRSTLKPTAIPSLFMKGGQPDYSIEIYHTILTNSGPQHFCSFFTAINLFLNKRRV